MGSFLGRLDVTLGDKGGVAGFDFKLLPIRAADYPEDPGVKALVDASLAPYRAFMATGALAAFVVQHVLGRAS